MAKASGPRQVATRRLAEESRHREIQAEILTLMAAHGVKTGTVTMDDARYRLTSVQGERLSIDEPGLRKALSAPVFDRLCNLRLDRTKLELSIAEGGVDPVTGRQRTPSTSSNKAVREGSRKISGSDT